jgi:hypothetical protein
LSRLQKRESNMKMKKNREKNEIERGRRHRLMKI